MMTRVLVTGATGNVGRHVVRELRERGVNVRAFVREANRAAAILPAGTELAVGDLAEPRSIRRALEGVDRLFLASATEPRQVALEGHAIEAAKAASVSRIVMAGAVGAQVGSPVMFSDWQGQIEQRLRESGVPTVFLRSAFYMTNLLMSAETIGHTARLLAPAGRAEIAMIDPRDVAAAAAVVLTEDEHERATYVLTGPEAITYEHVAAELSGATGRKVEFVDLPDEAARRGMLESGLPVWLVEGLVTLFGALRRGLNARVTGTFLALTGREPRSFAAFARDHAHLFRIGEPATTGGREGALESA